MAPETQPSFFLKRLLPRSLFGRALLILVLPVAILQGVALFVFYAHHWEQMQRHLSASITGEVAFLVHEMERADERDKRGLEAYAHDYLYIDLHRENAEPGERFPSDSKDDVFDSFIEDLKVKLSEPFNIRRIYVGDEKWVRLRIKSKAGVLRLEFSIKRVNNVTADVFVWWILGSAALLLIIAVLFLRNQIRPIVKLAEAAERFGKGQDSIDFRPQGASEVRQAGRSFLAMRERLKRLIAGRTEMLAAISHDLRTPLTRMRLELAMLPDQKYVPPILADMQEMEKMIQEYLDFARGESGEQQKRFRLSVLLGSVLAGYANQGGRVTLVQGSDPEVTVFPNAMRRCLFNIIDNALRYGARAEIRTEEKARRVEITIDDDGPGIPPESRDLAMQPFKRLDASRNTDTGGAGLGLSIVQDIVLRHGGEVLLEDSSLGGLRVKIRLPL